MNKYIRTNLASMRFARGRLTQRDVSRATGVGQKTLSALETGASKGIEFNTLAKLCAFFKCEASDLLIVEEEPEDIPPSNEANEKAGKLIALGLKAAMAAAPQNNVEIWAEFDAACGRLQQSQDEILESKRRQKRA